ncbi:glycoside hydrolase family 31 protein [Guyanagaster necrorhizus]|uniref:Glycoside hydrolase family 31 protein n=1 Tax=Guyanagaster necrorhizus TaxID=856835 RepID=A0A9P7VY85_9AGAR|nr:glycoside hydrolase family 31 protein [Guyanagaster necrorhizus MCA 3950]KAG7448767.1 glycoside hydrolase family 31 protein [Guyanagaster necrorhizus MCA 3950]
MLLRARLCLAVATVFPTLANAAGIRIINGFERVYIQPFGTNGVRVRSSLMRDPTAPSSALYDPPIEGPGGNQGLSFDTELGFQDSGQFTNGDLLVSVQSGRLFFYRREANGTDTLLTSEYADTKALPSRFYTHDFRTSSFQASFSFTSDPDEQFYGVGQQACCGDDSVNKKGQVIDLINFNSQVPIPVYMSNKGYLQFFNMPGQGQIEFSTRRTRFVASEATVVDYFITTAAPQDYDALQQQYTGVTGRQPTPPDFVLGYQQSKLRYWNQSQVIDVAQRFHDEKVNVSLIIVDFFAWKYQGDWSFDPEFWPDPAGMAAQVKELTGAEMMVSLWPSVEDLSVNYISLQQEGMLATTRDGTGVQDSFAGVYIRLVDSTNPAARQFLWKRLNDSYFSIGIHNFWIDQADGGSLGEPFLNNGQSISALPYARTFTQYFSGTQEATGKLYPWFHQAAIDEGLHNLTNSESTTSCEYMSLTRSTFAGGQRYCSYLWSGDTSSDFSAMAQQITAGVSVSASGISSWTLDIGGFNGLNVDTDAGRELFVRWFAMGVFLPYGTHRLYSDRQCNIPEAADVLFGNNCPNEPWAYGEENFVILKEYIALRYQLIPYVKKLFQMLQATGRTIMRPLYYDFSLFDDNVVNGTKANDPSIIHEYMFVVCNWLSCDILVFPHNTGPRILVAPVTEANVTSKEVYLPFLPDSWVEQGLSWTHWWTDVEFGHGGIFVNVSAELGEIPVFYLGTKEDIFSGNV